MIKANRSNVNINGDNIDNSVVVNGDNHGTIVSGRNNNSTTYSGNHFDWNGLQNDILTLQRHADLLAEGNLKSDLQSTAQDLQSAVDKHDESSVWSSLKKAGQGTLDFIKTISVQVLPQLILKKFG